MWSYRFYDRFRFSRSFHFSFLVLRYIVSFGSVACVRHTHTKCWWQNRLNACDKRFFSLFFSFRSLSYPDTKRPWNGVSGELISFYAELSLSLPVPAFYCIYFVLVLPVFNVVDNAQLNLGKRIRGVRPMNPKRFRSLRRKCYCERISDFLNY